MQSNLIKEILDETNPDIRKKVRVLNGLIVYLKNNGYQEDNIKNIVNNVEKLITEHFDIKI